MVWLSSQGLRLLHVFWKRFPQWKDGVGIEHKTQFTFTELYIIIYNNNKLYMKNENLKSKNY